MIDKRHALVALLAAAGAGCATTHEEATRSSLHAVAERRAQAEEEARPPDGSLASYIAYAMRNNPALEADFERFRAETEAIAGARRGPPLVISYTAFVRSIETRVGPQRGRLGFQQALPWPGVLRAGGDAASHRAEAAQRQLEASTLEIAARVARAYWELWRVHGVHRVHLEQEELLDAMSGSVRARLETGRASLSDLATVDLRLARHRDHHGVHREAARMASAALRRAIGAPAEVEIDVSDAPPVVVLPAEDDAQLREAALSNPRLARFEAMAEASESMAEREDTSRYPNFGVGFDWYQIGEAVAPVPDSGKDAVSLTVMMSVPLWQGASRDASRAARAEAAARRADGRAAADAMLEAVEVALARVRDAHRQVFLYRDTYLGQAETAYVSALGSYQAGRNTLADLILAQTQLLEVQEMVVELTARYAVAWASLEELVGRPVEGEEVTHD